MTAPPIRLLHLDVPIISLPMHEQQQKARDKKEDTIHDPKRKARLQHGAILVRVETKRRTAANTIIVDGDGKVAVGGKVCAVRVGDVAEFVDTGNECADEGKIDQGDEVSGVAGGFAAEDGDDSPGGGEDRDDEEDAEEVM